MNLRNRTLIITGCAASAFFTLAGTAQAQSVSFKIGGGAVGVAADECTTTSNAGYAGTLTIDGRSHRISTRGAVNAQIVEAFECAGYDAWCSGRSVRVRVKAGCENADICWRSGDYTLRTSQRGSVLTITPLHVAECDDGHGGDRAGGGWYGKGGGWGADRSAGRGKKVEKGRFAIRIEVGGRSR